MSNIYIQLTKEYCKQKNAPAIDIYGSLIYPGDKQRVLFDESMLDRIKKHPNYKFLDIVTQEEVDAEKNEYQEEIKSIVIGNYKRSEKNINQTTDKQKLKDIRKMAVSNNRDSIIKLVDIRLEELGF
jgi:hypothetical protein